MIYKRCLRYWRIAIFTPLAYLLICLAVDKWWFSQREYDGFWNLKDSTFDAIWIGMLVLCALMVPLILLLKQYWWANQSLLERRRTREAIQRSLINRFLGLLIICDTIAFIGLVLFLIQGEIKMAGYFGGCALLAYAAAHPSRLAIDKIYSGDDSDETPD